MVSMSMSLWSSLLALSLRPHLFTLVLPAILIKFIHIGMSLLFNSMSWNKTRRIHIHWLALKSLHLLQLLDMCKVVWTILLKRLRHVSPVWCQCCMIFIEVGRMGRMRIRTNHWYIRYRLVVVIIQTHLGIAVRHYVPPGVIKILYFWSFWSGYQIVYTTLL